MGEQPEKTDSEKLVWKTFLLKTNGKDQELDSLGVCLDALESISRTERERIVRYLSYRYGL